MEQTGTIFPPPHEIIEFVENNKHLGAHDFFKLVHDRNLSICYKYLESVQGRKITKGIMETAICYADNENKWTLYCEIMDNKKVTRAAAIYGYRLALCMGHADYRAIDIYEDQCFTTEEMLKSKKERKLWESLPDKVKLYRGCSTKEAEFENFGFSWSLKRQVAEFFAFRHGQRDRAVYSILIDKEDIRAIILERGEDEAIYFGSMLISDSYILVTNRPTEYYKDYINEIEKENKRFYIKNINSSISHL